MYRSSNAGAETICSLRFTVGKNANSSVEAAAGFELKIA
jgi:hypothetical protein